MPSLELKRISSRTDTPTFGVLLYEGMPFCVTLERPWLSNRRGESCIPLGDYRVVRCRNSPDYDFQDSPRFGDTFQVMNVQGRSKILFHKGNINDDTHGCIIVGEKYEPLHGEPAVLASGPAFAEFMRLLAGESAFDLSITDHFT